VCNHDLRASVGTLSVSTLNESPLGAPALIASVSIDGDNHVVIVSGELDVRTRQLVEQACLTGQDLAVVVEMSDLTFMDCCGYAGLVAIRRALLARGGSLTLSNQTGQPARLLALLGAAESARHAEHNGATMP
jgi:anti-anti-sigma factor